MNSKIAEYLNEQLAVENAVVDRISHKDSRNTHL